MFVVLVSFLRQVNGQLIKSIADFKRKWKSIYLPTCIIKNIHEIIVCHPDYQNVLHAMVTSNMCSYLAYKADV